MSKAQEDHIYDLRAEFNHRMPKKYRAGALEHPGNIWELPMDTLLDEAISEAIDQYVYLMTIKKLLAEKTTGAE